MTAVPGIPAAASALALRPAAPAGGIAAAFLDVLAGQRGTPTPAAQDLPVAALPDPPAPAPAALTLPEGDGAALAEIRAALHRGLGEALGRVAPAPGATGGAAPTAGRAAVRMLAEGLELLAATDTATGGNAVQVVAEGLARLARTGADHVPAPDPAMAAGAVADLLAGLLGLAPVAAPAPGAAAAHLGGQVVALAAPAARLLQEMAAPADPAPRPAAEEAPTVAPAAEPPAPSRAPAPPPPEPSALARTVLRQMQEAGLKLDHAGGRTSLDLTPAGLGRLELELETGAAGALRVILRAENPLVLEALRTDRAALAASLGDPGMTGGGFSFEGFGRPPDPQPGPSGAAAEPDAAPPTDPQHAPAEPGRGLDILA